MKMVQKADEGQAEAPSSAAEEVASLSEEEEEAVDAAALSDEDAGYTSGEDSPSRSGADVEALDKDALRASDDGEPGVEDAAKIEAELEAASKADTTAIAETETSPGDDGSGPEEGAEDSPSPAGWLEFQYLLDVMHKEHALNTLE